jgi:hypothetical protein
MTVKDNLKKALHKAILKAYQNGKKSKVVADVIHDIRDPNNVPQVPAKDLPAPAEGVLNKDISLSEIHQQKQANAMAKLGQAPKAPSQSGAFKQASMGASPKMPKSSKPLQSFMQKKEEKRNLSKKSAKGI